MQHATAHTTSCDFFYLSFSWPPKQSRDKTSLNLIPAMQLLYSPEHTTMPATQHPLPTIILMILSSRLPPGRRTFWGGHGSVDCVFPRQNPKPGTKIPILQWTWKDSSSQTSLLLGVNRDVVPQLCRELQKLWLPCLYTACHPVTCPETV